MKYLLSICIPTLGREKYIAETLTSIVPQINSNVEIVIVDGGPTDATQVIVKTYQERCSNITYLKSEISSGTPSNEGFDRDCNYAVEQANGEYCWIMTDDDIVKEGAVKTVLTAINEGHSLIVASIEVLSKDLTEVLQVRRPEFSSDRVYQSTELNSLAIDICTHLTFVGAVIIKKSAWLERDRSKYYGTGFIHVGVIFQKPFTSSTIVISNPLVSVRFGNALWTSRAFQIWMFSWPQLVWSFSSLEEKTKEMICPKEPWRSFTTLLRQRLFGRYVFADYKAFLEKKIETRSGRMLARTISIFPRILLRVPAYLYAFFKFQKNKAILADLNAG